MKKIIKKIEIKNFKNIKNIEFEYEEKKINMIYGISGSGKTTITKAITQPSDTLNNSENIPFEDPQAKPEINVINGDPDIFELYNSDSVNEFIFERTGKNIYNVLYDENGELKEIKKHLLNFQKKYLDDEIFYVTDTYTKNFNQMKTLLKLEYNANKTIKKNKTCKDLDAKVDYTISEENAKKIQWIKKGEEFYQENDCICPFCTQEIGDDFKIIIENFLNYIPDSIINIIEHIPLLTDLKVSFNENDIYSNETRRILKSELEEAQKIYDEICSIRDILSTDITTYNDFTSLSSPSLSQKTIELFDDYKIDIKKILSEFEVKLSGYLNLKNMYSKKFKEMIEKNIGEINKELQRFDIPYHFKKPSITNRNEGYMLSYKGMDVNHSNHLSEGEKSIASLVLFLYGNKNTNLIIDDPVSSFDEYRRDKVMKFLFKNSGKSTIIILSHDQIFLKFLLKDKTNKDKIGKIFHFENNAFHHRLQICEKNSINTITKFIIDNIVHSTDYLQKILNLRLLFEITNSESIEYCYLSGILHNFKKYESLDGKQIYADLSNHLQNEDRFREMLKKSGLPHDDECISEVNIIEKISHYIKNYTKDDFNLEPYSKENILNNSIENYSIFEQICFAREFFNATNTDKKHENEINEINSIIHFNYSMIHVLNPYKFNYYSNSIYSKLSENRDDMIKFFKEK